MRKLAAISTVLGFLAFGAAVPAYAQHDNHDQQRGGPPQSGQGDQHHGGPPQQGRGDRQRGGPAPGPPNNQMHAQPRPGPAPGAPGAGWRGAPPPPAPRPVPPPAAGNRPPPQRYAPPARPEAEARAWHSQGGWRQGAWPQHNNWQEHRSADWRADHRGWGQRGGYGGYYIPANRFERRFGPRHFFHLRARPMIYEGYPQFQYGGYTFLMVDPWPAYWGDDWYQNDDLYIAYDGDGYYLHNQRYPDVALAVTVNY